MRAPLAVVAAGAMFTGLIQVSAWAQNPAAGSPSPVPNAADPADVPAAQRDEVLGRSWKSSQDRAWATTADGAGFHVLTAEKKDGYAWKTAATLSEPGFDADMWIGNACVTGSGTRAVVVYAPRTFTNDPQLMARGGFTAVVDLTTGKVTKLDLQASLSYYNPGCGTDETAVITQSGGQDKNDTRLVQVDAATGRLSQQITVKGQVTSAVPAPRGTIAAARGPQLISVGGQGQTTTLAQTAGVPFRLTVDGQGGIVFLDKEQGKQSGTTKVKRVPAVSVPRTALVAPQPAVLAEGPAGSTGLAASAGTVYVTGRTRLASAPLPSSVRQLAGSPQDAVVTTRGEGVVTGTRWADGKDSRLQPQDSISARPVNISVDVPGTRKQAAFTIDPAARPSSHIDEGRAPSPKLAAPGGIGKKALRSATAGGDQSKTPVDDNRTCSVPRNDPLNQAMQPKPRQVEWAVDQAIVGNLNAKISRPANWKNLGMPAYQPQTLFPAPTLDGGGRVPAQVLLGVTAQESNMWQAASSAVPGVTGNPLIGNFYGINLYDGDTSNDWDINWAKADCGYGITQVTDHMRLAGKEDGHGGAAWPYQTQRAVALDYTANIAAGLQILAAKWNETRAAGLTVNDGAPAHLENWFYALWAYNSGFHPQSEAAANGGAWGLGWANNPANPEWDAGRLPFMEKADGSDDASAAAHPQNWPYPEKVLGFAAHPPAYLESPGTTVAAFRNAWWNGSDKAVTVEGSAKYNRAHVKPPENQFCDTSNTCDPSRISDSASNANATSGPCGRDDSKCWWNKPVTWKKDCSYSCGNELVRFNTTYAEEADGTAYPPACGNTGLPANAVIVDDVPTTVPSIRPNCPKYWDSNGTFTLDYWQNSVETVYPGKVDTHQLGAGFGGHFYFTHTRQDDAKGQRLKVTGSWKPNVDLKGQAKIMVHLPDHGAQTTRARYEIDTARGTETRVISQAGNSNRWVPLGVFRLNSSPEVRLSSITDDGTGDQDIAFDAVAFIPGTYDVPGAVPDIRLPDPNPNAPEPADQEPVSVLPGGPFSVKSSAVAPQGRSAAPEAPLAKNCTPVKGKPNTEICIGPATTPPKGLAAQPRAAAASGTPFCSTNSADRFFTRTKGCMQSLVDVQQIVNGTLFASWTYLYQHEIDLNVDSEKFTQTISLTPYKTDPKMVAVSVDIAPSCSPNCTTGAITWSAPNLWATAADSHTATATVEQTWTGTSGNDRMKLDWTLSGKIEGKQTTTASYTSNEMAVRCDREAKGTRNAPGCVFPEYTPTYVVNSEQNPAAAAFYWTLMQKLPSHPGSRDHNAPLNYLADKTRQSANRKVICPKDGPDKWVGNPASNPPGTTSSCDEYPFAATYQSGGMPPQAVDNGKQCTQLFASPLAGGGWTLLEDTNYSRVNTWDEICGRASIPGDENSGAANRIGLFFVPKNRMLDKDKFFVSTPGFEDCKDLSQICWVRTRK
ncbi:hypothetical protein [Streptomyces sp. NPDC059929]|uniref:golvesin C-terminal-like domain-containing protein n=1 Tax=Streptomyces sp. NPDC059929 TaxID=3347008 RepID=UPI00364D2BBF